MALAASHRRRRSKSTLCAALDAKHVVAPFPFTAVSWIVAIAVLANKAIHAAPRPERPALIDTASSRPLVVGAPTTALLKNAALVKKCVRYSDVDLPKLYAAAKQFDDVMVPFGLYSKVLRLATAEHLTALQKGPSKSITSARALLVHEKARGAVLGNNVLEDDSPALALLWLRRGFEFWLATFEEHLDRPGSFAEEAWRGYDRTSGRFGGWLMRAGARANGKLCPSWETVLSRGFAGTEQQLKSQLKTWAAAVRPLIARLAALHHELDMDDTRKA